MLACLQNQDAYTHHWCSKAVMRRVKLMPLQFMTNQGALLAFELCVGGVQAFTSSKLGRSQ